MATLHIVNKSPAQSPALGSCLRLAQPGDTVLLIEDAVYAATRTGAAASGVDPAHSPLVFRALLPDLEARGMAGQRLDAIEPLDYAGFVELAASHSTCQSWL